MILAIFVLAIVLLVSGGAGLVSAINLVPTDLGFTYFQASVTMLAAGAIILALGFAVRILDRGLDRMATPAAIRAALIEPRIEPLAAAPDHGALGGATAGAAAVAAAGLAGVGSSESISPEFSARLEEQGAGPPDARLEEFERDLFAELESRPQPPVLSEGSEDGAALSAASSALSTGADAAILAIETDLPRTDIPAPFWVTADRSPEAETADTGISAVSVAQEAPPAKAPPAVPGLIDDADLAAVSDDSLPSMAPISTLDVVGSYDSAGTRFTMYSDGSVTAAGPQGERRFRSLEELRRHLDMSQP